MPLQRADRTVAQNPSLLWLTENLGLGQWDSYAILHISKNCERRQNLHTMKTIILKTLISVNANFRNPVNYAHSQRGSFLILLVIAYFALSPVAQAVAPPPDGGYPGGNTAEGQNPLLSLTTGTYNTGIGIYSLLSLSDGNF